MTNTYIAPAEKKLPKVFSVLSIIFGTLLALFAILRFYAYTQSIQFYSEYFSQYLKYIDSIEVSTIILSLCGNIVLVFATAILSVSFYTRNKIVAKIGFLGFIIYHGTMTIYQSIYLIMTVVESSSYRELDGYYLLTVSYILCLTYHILALIAFIIATRKTSLSEIKSKVQHPWKTPLIIFISAYASHLLSCIIQDITYAEYYTIPPYFLANLIFWFAMRIVGFAIVFHTLPYGKTKTPKSVFAENIASPAPAMPDYTPEAEYTPTVANVPEPVYTQPIEEFPAPDEPAPQYTPAPEIPISAPVAPQSNAKYISEELVEYKKLLDMGIITQEEFDLKKKQLLGL